MIARRLRFRASIVYVVVVICAVADRAFADEAAQTETPLSDTDREHWAFVPPVRPSVPEVKNSVWCRTPIDRFILAKLEAAGLQSAPPADAATLLRRVTFDLSGLPPTPEELERNESYEACVDRLLASDAYAERQAQHWLDLARYADTDGYEHDNVRPEAWRYLGDAPSHPELLDWLAVEFVESGWDLQRLHRLIVTTAAYRQAGARPQATDPSNRLLSHFPRRRLDGEELRDAMLAVAGRLSNRRGGPGVMPPLPTELLAAIRKDHWKTSPDEEDHRRRSIYLFVRRNPRLPLLDAFDRPDTIASCPRRNRSTTAPQSLVLLNSEFAHDAAAELAKSLRDHESDDVAKQIELAYRACLGRSPTKAEATDAKTLVQSNDYGLVDFCLALFNLNEFAYVD